MALFNLPLFNKIGVAILFSLSPLKSHLIPISRGGDLRGQYLFVKSFPPWHAVWTCNKKVDSWLRVIMQLVYVLVVSQPVPDFGNPMPNASVFDYTRSQ